MGEHVFFSLNFILILIKFKENRLLKNVNGKFNQLCSPLRPLARAKKDGAGIRVMGAVKTHSAPASSAGGVLK